MSCEDTPKRISSLESVAGPSPCAWQDGPQMLLFGPDQHLANRFRVPASDGDTKMSGTCGLRGSDLSASAALQSSSASRLRAAMDLNGSMEYLQTWKTRVTPAGRPICALRAAARRTSDNGCTGWPSPKVTDTCSESIETKRARNARIIAAGNHKGCGSPTLPMVAKLTGWPTCQSRDHKGPANATKRGRKMYSLDETAGLATASSPAETARPGASVLNPAMSRWLMGFPATYDHCSPHWSEWDLVQKKLAECSGDREAFLRWLVEIALADSGVTATR